LNSFLALGTSVPYGIAVNPSNNALYVCGTDSARKWVKGFQVAGNFAVQVDELPSSTSNDVKDTKGAPFIAPSDVAFTKDGAIAYVTDIGANKVYKFSNLPTGITDKHNQVAGSFELSQNYPNPFNPSTQIVYTVPTASLVKAEVYNIYGELVSVLANGYMNAGSHALKFDGAKLASGTYICRITTGKISKSIKMLLLK
jgi:DNA-binding beta-propeller fold protein YncE